MQSQRTSSRYTPAKQPCHRFYSSVEQLSRTAWTRVFLIILSSHLLLYSGRLSAHVGASTGGLVALIFSFSSSPSSFHPRVCIFVLHALARAHARACMCFCIFGNQSKDVDARAGQEPGQQDVGRAVQVGGLLRAPLAHGEQGDLTPRGLRGQVHVHVQDVHNWRVSWNGTRRAREWEMEGYATDGVPFALSRCAHILAYFKCHQLLKKNSIVFFLFLFPACPPVCACLPPVAEQPTVSTKTKNEGEASRRAFVTFGGRRYRILVEIQFSQPWSNTYFITPHKYINI